MFIKTVHGCTYVHCPDGVRTRESFYENQILCRTRTQTLIYFLQYQNHCCAFVSKEILITCAPNRFVTLISYASKIYVRLRCKIARRDIFYYFCWTVYWIADKLCPGVSVINWYQIPTYSSPTCYSQNSVLSKQDSICSRVAVERAIKGKMYHLEIYQVGWSLLRWKCHFAQQERHVYFPL